MLYDFHCKEHGTIEMYQPMKDAVSKLPCPSCGKMMNKVWQPVPFSGCSITKPGNNRRELFKNLEADGIFKKGYVDRDDQMYDERMSSKGG